MVYGVETLPGEDVNRLIELTLSGETISLPLFIINGKHDGPTMAVTAGIHGTEYASIEAAVQLGRTLDPTEIYGRVVILPIVNIPSFKRRTVYVGPYDNKNLNRAFPGKQEGSFSEALAYQVFHEVILKTK